MDKLKRQNIRSLILDHYKLGNTPRDTSLRIQKIYGYNFETRPSTIRMWFEQFYLGDESLENDPFREDLIPKKREGLRKPKENGPSKISATSTSLPNSKSNSPNENQTKLLFQLKEQVDLLYRKINAQNGCLKLVDRFLENLNLNFYILNELDSDQNTVETFYTIYRFLRRKCRKLSNKNSFYEILYDNLYPNNIQKTKEKNRNTKKQKNIVCRAKTTKRTAKNKSKSTKLTNVQIRNKNIRRRKCKVQTKSYQHHSRVKGEEKWPILPIQVKTEPGTELKCPIMGCLHVANNQKMFTIHQSTHVDHSSPNAKQQLDPATCDECGKVLKNKYRLKVHIKQIHEQSGRQHCPFEGCDVSYTDQIPLRRHIQIVHTKDAKLYRCSWTGCSYSTPKNEMLRKHLNVHSGERPYKCVWPGCDKAFKSPSALDFHNSIHANKRQYKCQWPGCGYDCNVPQNLKKHTLIHERKQIQIIQPQPNDRGVG